MSHLTLNEASSVDEDGTALGYVLSSRGSEARICISRSQFVTAERTTIGKFVAISCGRHNVIGMITEVSSPDDFSSRELQCKSIAKIDLVGEIERSEGGFSTFRRGVRDYPAIGDPASLISRDALELIYSPAGSGALALGELQQDRTIPVAVDARALISKHFAVLGSTGVGKSSGTAVILKELVRKYPEVHVTLLDLHNEYGTCFGESASIVGAQNLRLPFWVLNLEEITDVIFGGKPAVAEELEILAELIPVAKGMYRGYKTAGDRTLLSRRAIRNGGCSADTPIPYVVQDLIGLIDERMGKLENRATRMAHHRLIQRIDGIRKDSRYAFMFENANVGGDTMVDILNQLFQIRSGSGRITVLELASLPGEVVDAVVCVTTRLAFEFGIWSEGAIPILLVCEEAHRYASRDRSVGFAPVRQALSRVAKEGRKYGIYLGLVTQRPAEIDPTIISQCSTLFFMRMANEEDQSILKSAVSDAGHSHLTFVPSLGLREVIGIGEAMPLPARFSFSELPPELRLGSDTGTKLGKISNGADRDALIEKAVESWRRSTAEKPPQRGEATACNDVATENSAVAYEHALRTLDSVSPSRNVVEPPRFIVGNR